MTTIRPGMLLPWNRARIMVSSTRTEPESKAVIGLTRTLIPNNYINNELSLQKH